MTIEPAPNQMSNRFRRVVRGFERVVVIALMCMMMLVIALSTLELGYLLAKDIVASPVLLLDVNELLEVFGFFLLILIGVELLETIKAYLLSEVVRIEIVLDVAMIAIARKVIAFDFAEYPAEKTFGIAAVIAALALAFLVKRPERFRK